MSRPRKGSLNEVTSQKGAMLPWTIIITEEGKKTRAEVWNNVNEAATGFSTDI